LAESSPRQVDEAGIELEPLNPKVDDRSIVYRHVSAVVDPEQRTADLKILGPEGHQPDSPETIREAGCDYWPLAMARELDDLLCRLRLNHETIGLLLVRTEGDPEAVLAVDQTLDKLSDHWLVKEILLKLRRTFKRVDQTARSIFVFIGPGSCFAGSLFELALAADRSYMLEGGEPPPRIGLGPLNRGAFPMGNGLSRLETRFLGEPERVEAALTLGELIDAEDAAEHGLVTFTPDDLDWDDEIRIAVEERAGFSPDAMTGMEASLRFAGPETMETKIFGRLTAWQNWIFQRPNAVGEKGALTLYGKPSLPQFDWRRT
jgi:benzoyl-CoA-dihydrodiol lyase